MIFKPFLRFCEKCAVHFGNVLKKQKIFFSATNVKKTPIKDGVVMFLFFLKHKYIQIHRFVVQNEKNASRCVKCKFGGI